jgi:hypothetical protein
MVSTPPTKRSRSKTEKTPSKKRRRTVSFKNKDIDNIQFFDVEEEDDQIPPTPNSSRRKEQYESRIVDNLDIHILQYLNRVYEYILKSICDKYNDFSSRKKELLSVIITMKNKFFMELMTDEELELEGLFLQRIRIFIYQSIHFDDFYSDCLANFGSVKPI